MILRERIIKKTKKVHHCNAWEWLSNSDISEIKMEFAEYRAIVKARKNNGKIEIGGSCLYQVGIYDGDFFYCHSIPELHAICCKYDIYSEY